MTTWRFLEVTQRPAANVGLRDLVDAQGRLHARLHVGAAQRILQRQRVHQRREHAHVVGGGSIHPGGTGRDAAKDVAAADHDRDFDAEPRTSAISATMRSIISRLIP